MTMTDPIADMLTRIRNAVSAKHRRVDMPYSKLKVEIARVLKESAYIQDYRGVPLEEGEPPKILRVILKYAQGGQPVIRELQRVSSPGLRKYVGVHQIPRVRNGLGTAILSTSQGVMTDRQARAARQGGELLAVVW
jgi:small subunit ribosomal protein S8